MKVCAPKAGVVDVADQGADGTGRCPRARGGIRGVRFGGLVAQRRDQIPAHGHEGLDRHVAGALFDFFSHPPACAPTLPSSCTDWPQSLGEIQRLSWPTRSSTCTARWRVSRFSM